MPIKAKTMGGVIKELKTDNKKSGKEKGQNGKPRSKKQIVAIAMNITKQPKMRTDAEKAKKGKKPGWAY